MSGEDNPKSEKSRICPSCRMQISVLAVKCRFCGEEVGKPKEEQRTLSINDLGGEVIQHRAPSGSVMEALEAFRVETGLDEGGENQHQPEDAPVIPTVGPDGMPVLNEEGMDGGFDSAPSSITSVREKTPTTMQDRVKTIGLAVSGLLVVVVLVTQAPGWISKYRESDADAIEPVFTNSAPAILDRGGPPIQALEAAVAAIEHEDSAQNRRIAEDALDAVIGDVRRLLNASPFNENNMIDASSLTTRAAELYPNEGTRDLVEEMHDERSAYRMSVIKIDSGSDVATFQPNERGAEPLEVQVGDTIVGRFTVHSMTARSVTVQDTMRRGRVITFEIGGGIRKK